MSDDAYGDPDDGSQVFIGFNMGSASLMQKIPHPNGAHTYQEWILSFFNNILYYNGVSVNSGARPCVNPNLRHVLFKPKQPPSKL